MNYYFTDEEVGQLKYLYELHESADRIGMALGRSKESIIQKVNQLGLKPRNPRVVRLVTVYGPHVLSYGKTPEKIRAGIAKAKAKVRRFELKQKREKQRNAVECLKSNLKTEDRNASIRLARHTGATLAQIGKITKLTPQAVSLICTPAKRRERHRV